MFSETKPQNVFFGGSFSLLDPSPCPHFGSKSHSDGLEVKGNLRIRGVKGWTETTDMADLVRGEGGEGGDWQLHWGTDGWLLVCDD